MSKKYVKGILLWLVLGPLTGPLAEGVIRNWRAGEVTLAWLYGVALWLTAFDMYSIGARATIFTGKLLLLQ